MVEGRGRGRPKKSVIGREVSPSIGASTFPVLTPEQIRNNDVFFLASRFAESICQHKGAIHVDRIDEAYKAAKRLYDLVHGEEVVAEEKEIPSAWRAIEEPQ